MTCRFTPPRPDDAQCTTTTHNHGSQTSNQPPIIPNEISVVKTRPEPTSILSFTIRYSLSFISDQRFLAFALSITLGCSALRRMSRCSLTSRSTSRDSARTLLNSVWYLRVEFRVQGSGFRVWGWVWGLRYTSRDSDRTLRNSVWYLTVESQGLGFPSGI